MKKIAVLGLIGALANATTQHLRQQFRSSGNENTPQGHAYRYYSNRDRAEGISASIVEHNDGGHSPYGHAYGYYGNRDGAEGNSEGQRNERSRSGWGEPRMLAMVNLKSAESPQFPFSNYSSIEEAQRNNDSVGNQNQEGNKQMQRGKKLSNYSDSLIGRKDKSTK